MPTYELARFDSLLKFASIEQYQTKPLSARMLAFFVAEAIFPQSGLKAFATRFSSLSFRRQPE